MAVPGKLHGRRSGPLLPGAWSVDPRGQEVCRGCVVRDNCLEYALDSGEKFGIWGGMSERERRRLRRARAIERRAQAG